MLNKVLDREFITEFVGTFILTFGGKATVLGGVVQGGASQQLTGALGGGLAVILALLVTASVSGGHINPCITFAWAVWGHFPWRKVPKYLVAQYLGAGVASLCVLTVYRDTVAQTGATVLVSFPNTLHSHDTLSYQVLDYINLMFDQFLASALLLLAFSSIVLQHHKPGPLLMGLCVTGIILALGPNAGCAMNPALDFMSRSISALWDQTTLPFTGHYSYWVIPLLVPHLGAVAGVSVHQIIYKKGTEDSTSVTITRI